jgi:hypothetical protein
VRQPSRRLRFLRLQPMPSSSTTSEPLNSTMLTRSERGLDKGSTCVSISWRAAYARPYHAADAAASHPSTRRAPTGPGGRGRNPSETHHSVHFFLFSGRGGGGGGGAVEAAGGVGSPRTRQVAGR